MTRIACIVLSSLLLATPGLAEEKKLQNDNLKDKNWERLEGQNQFKLGCRHLVRSEDKTQVYHARSRERPRDRHPRPERLADRQARRQDRAPRRRWHGEDHDLAQLPAVIRPQGHYHGPMSGPDISDDSLSALAGEATFERGRGIYQAGQVLGWSKAGSTITAAVQGDDLFEVTLTHNSRRFEGSCTCPASEGFDFCEHCVAATLAYREGVAEQQRLETGDADQRIHAYLNRLSRDELTREFLAVIRGDSRLRADWSVRADVALDHMDAGAIRKRITAAIPYRKGLFNARQVRNYFEKVEAVVGLLVQRLDTLEPADALALVDYAFTRLEKALRGIDDSTGRHLNAVKDLRAAHGECLEKCGWKTARLVDYLLALEAQPSHELYPPIPWAYAELLGESGLEQLFGHYQARWDALPPLPADAGWEQRAPYRHLETVLVERARPLW